MCSSRFPIYVYNSVVASYILLTMVKGGVNNRSFRSQRRKKRAKKFHGRRLSEQTVVGETDELYNNINNGSIILEDTVVMEGTPKTTASQRIIDHTLPATSKCQGIV